MKYPLAFKVVLKVLRDSGFMDSSVNTGYCPCAVTGDFWTMLDDYDTDYCKPPVACVHDNTVLMYTFGLKRDGEYFYDTVQKREYSLSDPECFSKILAYLRRTKWYRLYYKKKSQDLENLLTQYYSGGVPLQRNLKRIKKQLRKLKGV